MNKKWTINEINSLFEKSFFELIFQAQTIHRKNFNPNLIQISTLLSIKTGACPEDCKYCPQSARYKTNLKKENLLEMNQILDSAHKAKNSGSNRFCMGAAWRNPSDKDMPYLIKVIKEVKKLGMETCMTLGCLSAKQANQLSAAGLDYYNHNLDTSANYYKEIITTRTYNDRLKTLDHVRKSGMKMCSGGIIGLGEKVQDRKELLMQLANLPKPPESIPINMLVTVKGTPMENIKKIDSFEFIRIIAIARIMMPCSYIRLSAGRNKMNQEMQAMCFMAGANSIFYGCKLLTTKNPDTISDLKLFKKLGLRSEHQFASLNNELKNKKSLKNLSHTNNMSFYNASS